VQYRYCDETYDMSVDVPWVVGGLLWECRENAVSIVQPCCAHAVLMLRLSCQCVANMLWIFCGYAVLLLCMCFERAVRSLRVRCESNAASMFRTCCRFAATCSMLRRCFEHALSMLRYAGSTMHYAVSMLCLCRDYIL
jgi:hypothetical protein